MATAVFHEYRGHCLTSVNCLKPTRAAGTTNSLDLTLTATIVLHRLTGLVPKTASPAWSNFRQAAKMIARSNGVIWLLLEALIHRSPPLGFLLQGQFDRLHESPDLGSRIAHKPRIGMLLKLLQQVPAHLKNGSQ